MKQLCSGLSRAGVNLDMKEMNTLIANFKGSKKKDFIDYKKLSEAIGPEYSIEKPQPGSGEDVCRNTCLYMFLFTYMYTSVSNLTFPVAARLCAAR